MRAGVALGANLGDRLANLRAARKAILALPGVAPPILLSGAYETDPVDCEPGAGKFLNAVVEFGYEGDPLNLMKKLGEIERARGRTRNHPRNVSREIDIDLLYLDQMELDTPQLQLPHPRMHLRRFVLEPLADIRPELILPRQAKTVRELLANVDDPGKVVRLINNW